MGLLQSMTCQGNHWHGTAGKSDVNYSYPWRALETKDTTRRSPIYLHHPKCLGNQGHCRGWNQRPWKRWRTQSNISPRSASGSKKHSVERRQIQLHKGCSLRWIFVIAIFCLSLFFCPLVSCRGEWPLSPLSLCSPLLLQSMTCQGNHWHGTAGKSDVNYSYPWRALETKDTTQRSPI